MAALIPAALGAYQAISGGIKASKSQKALENMQSPTYQPNKAIKDYYSMALNKAMGGAYTTDLYKNAQQNANTTLAAGLGALNDRGGAIGGVSRLVGITNRSLQGAAGQAEQLQNQRLGQLGTAARAMAGEDRQAFQTNQMMPFENKFNLLAAKASGGNRDVSAGLQNINTGLQNYGEMRSAQDFNGGSYNFWGNMKKPRVSKYTYSGNLD